ncbi:MAG TPA: hypothetical protein DCQ33_17650 [Nitrospira sp.]|nr:hypothetical protein [Nitrospira sp.]
MQIRANSTAMAAGLCVANDPDGRELCVVVVKGTFHFDRSRRGYLADRQTPLVYADEYHGDPGLSSIRHECDFAYFKPRVDVIVQGAAMAPGDRPVRQLQVRVDIDGWHKVATVFGDRHWESGFFGQRMSEPKPFTMMPLLYENSFGGIVRASSKDGDRCIDVCLENPVGVGIYGQASSGDREPRLPNIERPQDLIKHRHDRPQPIGFGVVARSWQPRLAAAGTYDDRWFQEKYPFLPQDFSPAHFMCAPGDQQLSQLTGGEMIRCTNMTTEGTWSAVVPTIHFPVSFKFANRTEQLQPMLDTLLVEPQADRMVLIWRAAARLGHRLVDLREVVIGEQAVVPVPERAFGKLKFRSLSELVAWRRAEREEA